MTTIFRCKNQVATFNKRSNELKQSALNDGMTVTKEWTVGEFLCFHAEHAQSTLKRDVTLFAECGACVNVNPRMWYTRNGFGGIDESVYLQKG